VRAMAVPVVWFVSAMKICVLEGIGAADSLYALGTADGFKRAVDLCERVLDSGPSDYDAAWKCARACRAYANAAKQGQVRGWEKVCAAYGKAAMSHAELGIRLDPARVEAYYFYGLSVGIYSDGVSVITALREGLKDRTQKNLEKAFEMDRAYDDGGPAVALGRFWAVVPWPFRDRKKALLYYRDYQKITTYKVNKEERMLYIAELLVETGGKDNNAEARELAKKALVSESGHVKERARKLLEKLQ
jgi:hypothetical protein